MAEATEVAGQRRVVLAKPRRQSVWRPGGRQWLGAAGLYLVVGGVAASFVLGNWLAGLPMTILGFALIFAAAPTTTFPCPYCGRPLSAMARAESIECPRCRQRTIVDWQSSS